ncbi:hypothetical protein [Bosea vaviloviae]|uniref:Uncharacterized protein n=1 Tax=Bosea vaviloviae TaxID=1526658 RepID=A0A1D7U6B2_9HYPH|nr:hypothetical protein [Bosea vaviloviae]AOO82919.1 hypothetical protein BHK69_22975 [Bosea vaviloviae]
MTLKLVASFQRHAPEVVMDYGDDLTLAILRECQEFEDTKSSRTQAFRLATKNDAAVAQKRRALRVR